MKEPTHIIPQGTRVRTHDRLPSPAAFFARGLRHRVASAPGVTTGIVGGHGGDVYWVRHEDGSVAPYGWYEFELEEETVHHSTVGDVEVQEVLPRLAPIPHGLGDGLLVDAPKVRVLVRDDYFDVDCACGVSGTVHLDRREYACPRCGFTFTWSAPAPSLPPDINPGIRRLVGALNRVGFTTTDSGDGETHDHECDRDHGYVVVIVRRAEDLVAETHRLQDVLMKQGIRVVPQDMGRPEVGCCYMQAMYCPVDGFAVIDVSHVHDRMLAPEDPGNVEMTCIKCGGLVVTAVQPPGVDVLPICAACRAGAM